MLFIFIELMIIISLCIVIKAFIREQNAMQDEMNGVYKAMEYKVSDRTKQIFDQANSIRLKLPTELYPHSFKKNTVVKETCDRFYELLTKHTN